jgi:hypothetical protein
LGQCKLVAAEPILIKLSNEPGIWIGVQLALLNLPDVNLVGYT